MREAFSRISNKVSNWTGSATAFLLAFGIVAVWAITGPIFNFSSNWQLVINTGTTIVTFLMVFLIQNTQNRDGKAMQLKLDELIRTSSQARNTFMNLEELTDVELSSIDEEFKQLHEQHAIEPNTAMHKLHKKIEAEHKRRQSLSSQAGHMIGNILNTNKD